MFEDGRALNVHDELVDLRILVLIVPGVAEVCSVRHLGGWRDFATLPVVLVKWWA